MIRVVHQAVQNGAKTIFVRDEEMDGRIILGKPYGFYIFQADPESRMVRDTKIGRKTLILWEKRLTHPAECNIMYNCDVRRKCSAKAPE